MGDSADKPHDAVVQHTLAVPANAAAQVRPLLQPELADQIVWSELTRVSTSFISKHLRGTFSDILFCTRTVGGHDAFVYLLVEHQSRSDPLMAFRMIDYLVSIWNAYLREHPKSKTLPLIVPVVVHASPTKQPWSAPVELCDLIEVEPGLRSALAPHLPRLRFILDDLSTISLAELCARPSTPPTLTLQVLLKTAPKNKRLDRDLEPLLPTLSELTLDDLTAFLTYILSVGDTSGDLLQPLIDRIGPQGKEAIVTAADQLRAEGRAEAKAEGRTEGQADLLRELLTLKFGTMPTRVTAALRHATPDQLRQWAARILTAETLDDMRIA
ncbi:Rpn family recombination-promoting nuclease/putative transposase [Nocardia rhizosphaerae]|uniref:Rpn family recombination-promoting nuclease/putative transposase n=1 Tax=Nocardia rhizosphaerae TaxID=1691571 RepID=A0ABV8L237_9NOCA